MPVLSLNVYAGYACRHAGACCTAGWNIPVEPELRNLLGADILIPDADGGCRYFDRLTHLCSVHRDHGHDRLPASCQHFPRRALIDDRGTRVTLSNFCPTAASLLFEHDGPVEIVKDPAAFPSSRRYDGLDARGEWAPLVRPGLLFDFDGYDVWERFIVGVLASGNPVGRSLGRLALAAERLRLWTSEDGDFSEWAQKALSHAHDASPEESAEALERYSAYAGLDAYQRATDTVPKGLSAPTVRPDIEESLDALVRPEWDCLAAPVGRYLASKAFASWSAYDGLGVRTLVAELVVCHAVLQIEAARASKDTGRRVDAALLFDAIRASDWLLIHLVDRPRLMNWLTRIEDL